MEIEMIAHDGFTMPRNVTLSQHIKQQIHIYGRHTFCSEGRILTAFRDDLERQENPLNSRKVKRWGDN